jgi:hypothetical protein
MVSESDKSVPDTAVLYFVLFWEVLSSETCDSHVQVGDYDAMVISILLSQRTFGLPLCLQFFCFDLTVHDADRTVYKRTIVTPSLRTVMVLGTHYSDICRWRMD